MTVLHVLPEETAGNPEARKLSQPIFDSMVQMFESQLGTLKCEFILETGATSKTILQVAHDRKIDLIAMGIRGAFLNNFSLGTSVAYKVMAGAECPVVTGKG